MKRVPIFALIALLASTFLLSTCKKDEPAPEPKNSWKKAWYTLVDGANCEPLPGITFTCLAYKLKDANGDLGSGGYEVYSSTEYTSDSLGRFFVDMSSAPEDIDASLEFGEEFYNGTHPKYFLDRNTYDPSLPSVHDGVWEGQVSFKKIAHYKVNIIDHPDSIYKSVRFTGAGFSNWLDGNLDFTTNKDTSFITNVRPSSFCMGDNWENFNTMARAYETTYIKGGGTPWIRKIGTAPIVRGGDTAEINIYYRATQLARISAKLGVG